MICQEEMEQDQQGRAVVKVEDREAAVAVAKMEIARVQVREVTVFVRLAEPLLLISAALRATRFHVPNAAER